MNKYLKLLFAAIFVSMSFAFVACGDEKDDEPDNNGSGGSSQTVTLTLDGKKYTFNAGLCEDSGSDLLVELYKYPEFTPWISFVFFERSSLSDGMVLTPDVPIGEGGSLGIILITLDGRSAGEYELTKGKVTVDKIDEKNNKFKVTFHNAYFKEFVYGEETLTVEGTFSVTLDSNWGGPK